jgi:hypothetical protein
MSRQQPSRRGFLGALAAALALPAAFARRGKAPTADDLAVIREAAADLKPVTWCVQEHDPATGVTSITLTNGGCGYTSSPVVSFSGGGATATPTLSVGGLSPARLTRSRM